MGPFLLGRRDSHLCDIRCRDASRHHQYVGQTLLVPYLHVLTDTEELYAAMASVPGVSIASDSGAGENGLYWYSTSHDAGTLQRSYARTGHWDNVPRDNYEMVVGAKANQIIFDDTLAATGVRFVSLNETNAEPVIVRARKEVIIAAGAVHTPQVLMLSGIGPQAALEDLGITVNVDLPGVGSNFQDHSYIPSIRYQCKSSIMTPCFTIANLK